MKVTNWRKKLAVARIVFVITICAMANAASAALIGYYGLNETGTLKGNPAVDSSGSSQNGVYAAAGTGPVSIASVNAGLYGTAVHFDSTAGHTDYADMTPFNGLTQTGAFTYAAWVNPDSTQLANPTILGNLNSNGRGYDLRIVSAGSGNWNLRLTNPIGAPTTFTTIATIPSGQWTHVAVTKDVDGSGGPGVSNVQFYVNGIAVDAGTIGLTGATNQAQLYIAAGRSATQYFGGGVDEVRIYNEVLTGSAIAGLAVVPEPATVVLVGLGAVALLGWGRRRDTRE